MPKKCDPVLQPIREAMCLEAWQAEIPIEKLMLVTGRCRATIYAWIARAKEAAECGRAPKLDLLMSPASTSCGHSPDSRPDGMPWLCLDCLQTGLPGHPAFRSGAPVTAWEGEREKPHQPAKFKPRLKNPKTAASRKKPTGISTSRAK